MANESEMQRWIECRFQGLTKDQLMEAGEVLNCTFDRRSAEKTMRLRLCEKIGIDSGEEPEKIVPPVVPLSKYTRGALFDPKPNLLPGSRWGGKRHNLIVFQPHQDSEHPQNYFKVGWEGQTLLFAYGIKLSMSHPHFQSLKTSVKRTITQKAIVEEGVQVGVRNIETESPNLAFQYIGVEPGTEDLPESICQYWQWQAAKHNNFKTPEGKPFNRRVLQGIRSDLYGPVGSAFYKDLTDEDILYDILRFLHGDNADEAMAA